MLMRMSMTVRALAAALSALALVTGAGSAAAVFGTQGKAAELRQMDASATRVALLPVVDMTARRKTSAATRRTRSRWR
jgi:hypothetical protein